MTVFEYTVTWSAPASSSRWASTSGGRPPRASASSTDAYCSIAMPVSERFRSNIQTDGDAPARAVTVIG